MIGFSRIWSGFGQIGPEMVGFGRILIFGKFGQFGRTLSDLDGLGRIWSDSVGFGQIRSDSVGFGRIWSDWSDSVGVAPGRGPIYRVIY